MKKNTVLISLFMALCSIAYTQTTTEKYLGDDGILYILQMPNMEPVFC